LFGAGDRARRLVVTGTNPAVRPGFFPRRREDSLRRRWGVQ
jgi:hypothetical protein